MNNNFGKRFNITFYGGSHTESLGVIISGVPQGLMLTEEDFAADIDRRRAGAKGTTPRREGDVPHIVSGVEDGVTTGDKLEIVFYNENTRSGDYDRLRVHPRPSHADLTARHKYGEEFDLRGGGIFSGRMTLLFVAAGVVAKKILRDATFSSSITEIGGCRDAEQFESVVAAAQREGDSVGGVVECIVTGAGRDLGEPFFDSVESVASHLLFAVPAVKGVEFGSGFEGVRLRGSERNDLIIDDLGTTATNNEGGINGGITNGNPVVVRVAIKPTPSIGRGQQTYNFESQRVEELNIGGRHDACIVLRAAVVVEAVMAIALAELKLSL
ncbi:MAG: chorismate synthase [Rikenellaceae bacterium]|nr:chorismate synthase [Rikenellaceae bacterium]